VARSIKLLLTENVDNLGIVGDVVNVRIGYARNYLLPRELATTPSDEILAQLAEKRAQAEKDLAALRSQRESLISKLEGLELTLTRSCNDQGHLYGSVTQHDIAEP
jgi:large subunit ribosomal protein L9